MARITVEDCLEQLPNRFSLVLVSAERAKQWLLRGSQPLVDNLDGNKEVVIALREIAAGHFDIDDADVTAHHDWLPVGHHEAEARIAAATADIDDELPPEF